MNKFLADIKNIRAAIDTHKLVVFAGAGISIDAGVPAWGTLINEFKSEMDILDGEQDYLRIAQMYYNDRQQKEYIDKIKSVLKHKKVQHNEIHEEIFQLQPEHILTTNYDDLLEEAIRKRSLPFSVVSKDKEFPYAHNTNLLVKINGDLDDVDIVLKEDDYLDYSMNHPLIEAFIKSVFASKIVLFVGYSFSDINLKIIIQQVRNILGKDFQNAYLLTTEQTHPSQKTYLQNKGINVVSYKDANYGKSKNFITEYLHGNNAVNEIYHKQGNNLSSQGQQLLNFLRFLSNYDRFNDPLTQKNIIDQIFDSLQRFSELKSLPPDFIANLFPFNTSTEYIHNYEPYSIITRNQKLYKLFKDHVQISEGFVSYNPPEELRLSEEQIRASEEKLVAILKMMNYSLIFRLFRENEKADSIGYKGWSSESINLKVLTSDHCNCINCRLSRLEFDEIIGELGKNISSETGLVEKDMALAYSHYKVGNFAKAYKLFDDIANRAWLSGKYISYFIAKHNAKTLRNLIFSFTGENEEKDENKRQGILREIDSIDLDKLLFEIPYMGDKEYELLKMVRDDRVLTKASQEIDEIHKNILSMYESYKVGRFRSIGPYYPTQIEQELYKIVQFYTANHIVSDEFTQFIKVVKKGVEALLISYATKEEYDAKLKSLNKFFFDLVVNYCDASQLKELTQKFEINSLEFDEHSKEQILIAVNNFLKSFFYKTTYFGEVFHANDAVNGQTANSFFTSKCRQIANNIFLLLSGMKITRSQSETLAENVIHFLEVQDFLFPANSKFVAGFISKNTALFTEKDFIAFVELIAKGRNNLDTGILLQAANAIKEKNGYVGITNKELLNQLIVVSKSSRFDIVPIADIWSITSGSLKETVSNKIIELLNQKFDPQLYVRASLRNIIDHNLYLEQYILYINERKTGVPTTNNNHGSFEFFNAMIFLYEKDLTSADKRLKKFTNLDESMKFFLFPETFDYKHFDIEWLWVVGDRNVFYKRFKKIPALKKAVKNALAKKFDPEIAELYIKYLT